MRKGTKKLLIKEEQTDVILSFSGTKTNIRFCSKNNSDRRGTDRGIPKLFRNGEKRTDLFQNYSVTNVSGSTQTGISQVQLDVATSGTASTFVVQAIDISQDPLNSDLTVSNANIMVRISNHFYKSGTGI